MLVIAGSHVVEHDFHPHKSQALSDELLCFVINITGRAGRKTSNISTTSSFAQHAAAPRDLLVLPKRSTNLNKLLQPGLPGDQLCYCRSSPDGMPDAA
ncbi:hypothetical protein ACJ73_00842 [Blastomyces percursus]|uniref:Uncharacterized protein n=1 Tax=Blastomyces percursus TaxID=1658174 RepID=A0A1J9RJI1_9EURO|nr:hypothetical protein ACJ73_00842 [Blastomyces percursus]